MIFCQRFPSRVQYYFVMMMQKKKLFAKLFKNQKGQVALFVALIFQVLFAFFAMLINVGLLVHHKINLQNSVDLAAYYGAMKQAEILNFVAHTNYQIRQSWKLLSYRYRHIGNFGYLAYQGIEDNTNSVGVDLPTFCTLYYPFTHMNPSDSTKENYCKDNERAMSIPLPGKPSFVSGNFVVNPFIAFQSGVINFSEAVRQQVKSDCAQKSPLSIYSLYRFIFAYKLDVYNRKKILYKMANRMSKSTDDFKDFDGESVKEGVEKTLKNNLTYQNKEAKDLEIKFFNSMGAGECRSLGGDEMPPGWLNEISVYPVYQAFVGVCHGGTSVNYVPRLINANGFDPANEPDLTGSPFWPNIKGMNPYVQEPDGSNPAQKMWKSTLGFEKNPWCMSYVGVEAKTTPQIPFSPFGQVTLRAKAYAKPFGGSVGPWYKKQWSQSSKMSDQGDDVEKISPTRIIPPDSFADTSDPRLRADYPRYIGDDIGTKSRMNITQFNSVIKKHYSGMQMDLRWWDEIVDPNRWIDSPGTDGDILAWDIDKNSPPPVMRDAELAVIAPTNFDAAYFSIEPDFYRNYYLRLINSKSSENQFDFNIRGDLGMRKNTEGWKIWSIKEMIKRVQDKNIIDVQNILKYYVKAWPELLTGFKAKGPEEPSLSPDYFGKCENASIPDDRGPEFATTGNCYAGGRVGYSVKIVDGEYLRKSDLELGGKGVTGSIKNQPGF